ncbi:MAG: hypothetical protein AAFU79_10235 [Myxococcota bacterium]
MVAPAKLLLAVLTLPSLAGSLSGCASASGDSVGAAVGAAALALAGSATSRAQGGCFAACGPGTLCNPENGLCEPLDCGACPGDEVCDAARLQCVPRDTRVEVPATAARPIDLYWGRARPFAGENAPAWLRVLATPASTSQSRLGEGCGSVFRPFGVPGRSTCTLLDLR